MMGYKEFLRPTGGPQRPRRRQKPPLFKNLEETPKEIVKILEKPLTPKSEKCELLVVKEAWLNSLTPNPYPLTPSTP